MRQRLGLAAVAATTLLTLTGFGATTSPLKPGDRVAGMLLVKGTVATADQKLFDICDPVVLGGGTYHRQCGLVPRVRRLFVGYGSFAPPRAIDTVWVRTAWAAWLDGRRIQLPAFGTSDRTLYAFPPAGGKDVTLREWRVMLLGATPGRHTIRYRAGASARAGDITWTFAVAAA
jgi:hypothetical protein